MARLAYTVVFCLLVTAIGGMTSAQAATPVEYVKVCETFGTGFYYIPGTDTCLKIGGYVRAEPAVAPWGDGYICNNRFGQTQETCRRGERVKSCWIDRSTHYYVPGTGACLQNTKWTKLDEVPPALLDKTYTSYTTPTPNSPLNLALIGGVQWTHYSSKYSSTGSQAAFDGRANDTGGVFLGQIRYGTPLGNGTSIYAGLNGGYNFTGTTTLFDILRHNFPPGASNGHVIATVDPGAVFEPFIEFRGPITPGTYAWVSPSVVFEHRTLKLTSDQTAFGGEFESASQDYWAHGWGLRAGVSHLMCPNCFLGQPLTLSVGGNATWFTGSKSLDLRSSAFAFTETATLDKSRQYGIQAKLTTPLALNMSYRAPPP